MIPTVNAFNTSKFSVNTGIVFSGNANNYRVSQSIVSVKYPSSSYHFEFWEYDGSVYICLHTDHNPNGMNLSILINSRVKSIISHLKVKFSTNKISSANIKGLSGASLTFPTHNINIKGFKGNPSLNAEIMYELIVYVMSMKI